MPIELPPISNYIKPVEETEKPPPYLYDEEEINKLINTNNRIYGVPAASLTWGINGVRNSDVMIAGREGELATAKVLEEFSEKVKGIKVFHSLRFEGSMGDTDHALVYKDLVIIIDSKRWKGTRKYSLTPNGEIKRGTVAFEEGKVKIAGSLGAWRQRLKKTLVKGMVAISQDEVFVVRDRNWYKAPFRLVEIEKLEAELLTTLKQHKSHPEYTTNTHILRTLAGWCVKPYDPREGLIQGSPENPFKF
jgi:hypothetical protein